MTKTLKGFAWKDTISEETRLDSIQLLRIHCYRIEVFKLGFSNLVVLGEKLQNAFFMAVEVNMLNLDINNVLKHLMVLKIVIYSKS